MNILEEAKKIIKTEAGAVEDLSEQLDQSFVDVVKAIHESQVKWSLQASENPAMSVKRGQPPYPARHTILLPTQHGRLAWRPRHGRKKDIVILISNSGKTKEVLSLLPSLNTIGPIKIAITSISDSTLARNCDYTLAYCYPTEADHLNLAPTTSSSLTLALGDALAGTLSKMKNFANKDFLLFHPSIQVGVWGSSCWGELECAGDWGCAAE